MNDDALCEDSFIQNLDINCDQMILEILEDSETGGICYFPGYLTWHTCKNIKCEHCLSLLVTDQMMPSVKVSLDEKEALSEYYECTRLQDRGGQLCTGQRGG